MPYGESFISEHTTSTELPYLFNGKPLDEETGLYYYGARYYEPSITIWYGVDLLWEKHPNLSPYIYVVCNPLKYIDLWGMTEEERTAAVAKIKTYIGNSYSTMDCSETVDRAIRSSTEIGTLKKGSGVSRTDGKGMWANGVALIVSNSREIEDIQNLKVGNAITFRSGRSDHKGEDGKFDHIGMVSEIIRNDDNEITAFKVIHSSSSGVKEQTYDLTNKMPGFTMKGAYAWDTPLYDGGTLEPVIVEGQRPQRTPITLPQIATTLPSPTLINNKIEE